MTPEMIEKKATGNIAVGESDSTDPITRMTLTGHRNLPEMTAVLFADNQLQKRPLSSCETFSKKSGDKVPPTERSSVAAAQTSHDRSPKRSRRLSEKKCLPVASTKSI
jgi:hypothetical protein